MNESPLAEARRRSLEPPWPEEREFDCYKFRIANQDRLDKLLGQIIWDQRNQAKLIVIGVKENAILIGNLWIYHRQLLQCFYYLDQYGGPGYPIGEIVKV